MLGYRDYVFLLQLCFFVVLVCHYHDYILEHIGHVVGMSVSGYIGWRFEPRQQYVVSLSKTLYPQCFSRVSCEMSTRWGQPCEGCSVL